MKIYYDFFSQIWHFKLSVAFPWRPFPVDEAAIFYEGSKDKAESKFFSNRGCVDNLIHCLVD